MTVPAGYTEGNNDAITHLQILHSRANFHNFAHEFMADDIARLHGGDVAIVDVQIGTANGSRSNAQNGITWIQNLGIWNVLHSHIMFSIPADSPHLDSSFWLFLC